MAPSLDSCLNDIYEPGNIPADSGQTPSVPLPFGVMVGTASGVGAASALPFGFAIGRASGVGAAMAFPAGAAVGAAAGVGAASGASPAATLTYQTTVSDTTDGTTFTFTSQPIGTAAADRRVIVGTVQGNTNGVTATSVTVGGTGLTLLKRQVGGAGSGNAEIWMGAIPSGTTATVVVTWGSLVGRSSATIWSVTGLQQRHACRYGRHHCRGEREQCQRDADNHRWGFCRWCRNTPSVRYGQPYLAQHDRAVRCGAKNRSHS